VSRYSFLLASPEYLETSGLFKFTGTTEQMGAGDAIWFPGDSVCHRGVPSQQQQQQDATPSSSSSSRSGGSSRNRQKRRLLFWFSWDSTVLPAKLKPDIDFQLNPWTLYSLVHPNFDVDLVSVSFSFDEIVFSHSFLFTERCSVLSAMDGLSSILPLWRHPWRGTGVAAQAHGGHTGLIFYFNLFLSLLSALFPPEICQCSKDC
jgi:hypothetical protein